MGKEKINIEKAKRFFRKLKQNKPALIMAASFAVVVFIDIAFTVFGAVVLSLLFTGEILPKPLYYYLCIPVIIVNGIFIVYVSIYLFILRKKR